MRHWKTAKQKTCTRVVLNCFDKTFTCVNNEGETVTVIGIPRKTTIRQIFDLQLKRVVRKGCKAFVVTVTDEEHINNEDKLKLEDIPILRGYSDVFSEEILGLPLKGNWISLLSWYLVQCLTQNLLTR